MSPRLKQVGKWAWIACVMVAVAWFVHREWPQLSDGLQRMGLPFIGGSLLLTIVAKSVLGENARLAACRCGINLTYPTALRLYNLSQLGKYIPGSIWQYVGRAAAYRSRGAAYAAVRDSLLIESLWVVASAFVIGLILVGSNTSSLLRGVTSSTVLYWLTALVSTGCLLLLVALFWRRKLIIRYLHLLRPSPWVLLVEALVWVLLGLAFWLLAVSAQLPVGAPYAIGLFALAFAFGFLVPIAPAGLGIRDGILMLGLLPYGNAGNALAVTVVARLIYVVAEVGLVAAQELLVLVISRMREIA